jgi:hypothetical protein
MITCGFLHSLFVLYSIYDFLNKKSIKVLISYYFWEGNCIYSFNKPLLNVCHVPDPAVLEEYRINQLTPAFMGLKAKLGGQPEALTLMHCVLTAVWEAEVPKLAREVV